MSTMAVLVAIGTFVTGCFTPWLGKKAGGWLMRKLTFIR